MLYTADFETTTDKNDCRAWAWGVCEVGKPESFIYGNNVDDLFSHMKHSNNSTYYFHNLKFDSDTLFIWMFKNGFKHVKSKKEEVSKSFSTLISGTGLFYGIRIVFEKRNKKICYAQIYDSHKILPFKCAEVAKAFGLPFQKLELDYHEYRPVGHVLTPHEVEYLKHDVVIMALALDINFKQGLTAITQGSNALNDFMDTIGKDIFKYWFPTPWYDKFVRQAYKGGYTYVSKLFQGLFCGMGLVLDVNSLYPWAMRECLLPCYNGVPFDGKYKENSDFPLYVQTIQCHFKVKEGFIPTIQLKNNPSYIANVYVEETDTSEDPPIMTLTSVDLKLFFEHYDVDPDDVEYLGGYMFKGANGMFTEYIDKWMKIKEEATISGNKALRTIAKLMMNGLYGKFAVAPEIESKIPYMEDETIHFSDGPIDTRNPLYIPVAAFITAYAREKTIRSAQKVYDKFAYADTDSLHLIFDLPEVIRNMSQKELENLTTADLIKYGVDLPEDFEVHPTHLGAWKIEGCFTRAKYLRQKCYVEDSNHETLWGAEKFNSKELKELCEKEGIDYDEEMKKYIEHYDTAKFKITCAGMPDNCHPHVTWENFEIGASYTGKLKPVHVKGGTVLVDTDFTIRHT